MRCLAGGTIPQVGALSSARWSHLLAGRPVLSTAFALESLTNAVAFLVGPTLVGTVAGYAGAAALSGILADSLGTRWSFGFAAAVTVTGALSVTLLTGPGQRRS